MEDSPARTCSFDTSRLRVEPWHNTEVSGGADLAAVLTQILTEATTASLPEAWQGAYSVERARAWIAERDAESPTLLVVDRSSSEPVGLVLLAEMAADGAAADGAAADGAAADGAAIDLRIGYVLAESSWGRGLATELVTGLVDWARDQPTIHTLTGGVATNNPASAHVLVKNGFSIVPEANHDGETMFQLVVRAASEWDDVADGWDDDEAARAYAEAAFGSLLALLERRNLTFEGARVCDFGCGTGLLTERMAGAASEIVAVDSSVKMLEVLRAKGARHGWTTVRPTTQIPMAGDGFDLIVCSSVCSFLDDYPAVARQLASLLRPGGLFVQWDWERDEGDPDGHGLTGNEIIDALTSAELEDVSVLIGFEVSFGDQIMRPLMGHGRRSVA